MMEVVRKFSMYCPVSNIHIKNLNYTYCLLKEFVMPVIIEK